MPLIYRLAAWPHLVNGKVTHTKIIGEGMVLKVLSSHKRVGSRLVPIDRPCLLTQSLIFLDTVKGLLSCFKGNKKEYFCKLVAILHSTCCYSYGGGGGSIVTWAVAQCRNTLLISDST